MQLCDTPTKKGHRRKDKKILPYSEQKIGDLEGTNEESVCGILTSSGSPYEGGVHVKPG